MLFPEVDRVKYLEMISLMRAAIVKETTTPKVALLTFKVVEETIKRAYMKAHVTNLMPVEGLTSYRW